MSKLARALPLEERSPGLAVGSDPPDALVGWRHVEHHDVVRVVGEHALQVTLVDGRGPALDQRPDLARAVQVRVVGPLSVWVDVVDDAELVAVRVAEHDEVGVGWVRPVLDPGGAQLDQPLDVARLLGRVEVHVDGCRRRGRGLGELQRERWPAVPRVDEHHELGVPRGLAWAVPQRGAPEVHGPSHVLHVHHHGGETQVAQRRRRSGSCPARTRSRRGIPLAGSSGHGRSRALGGARARTELVRAVAPGRDPRLPAAAHGADRPRGPVDPAGRILDEVVAPEQHRPVRAHHDVGKLVVGRHDQDSKQGGSRACLEVEAGEGAEEDVTEEGGLPLDQRLTDLPDGELLVHGVGLDVLEVVRRDLLGHLAGDAGPGPSASTAAS